MDQNDGYLNYIFLVFIFLLIQTPDGLTGEPSLFRIGTGGKTGMYYPLGKLIAQGLTGVSPEKDASDHKGKGIPGLIGVAQNSAGSIELNKETGFVTNGLLYYKMPVKRQGLNFCEY